MPTLDPSELNIALVQFDIAWLSPADNFKQIEHLLAGHDLISTDLLLLPETFSTGFAVTVADCGEEPNGQALQWMLSLAETYQTIVAGSVLVKLANKKSNRFYWVWPNGGVQYYDKKHLFTLAREDELVHAGTERKIFQIKDFRILPQVCYDLRFPVWNRNQNDYELMVNVANWPVMRRDAWDTLLKARAIENQAFVIGVNRIGLDGTGIQHTGGSAVYAYDGKVLKSAKDSQAEVIFASLKLSDLQKFRSKLPFYQDADDFEFIS